MAAVEAVERALGFEPRDVSKEDLGYDIESRDPESGHLRFIEVKGRVEGGRAVTVTRNEMLFSFNSPEQWILALVEVRDGEAVEELPVRYLREPFDAEPGFAVASVNLKWQPLWAAAGPPAQEPPRLRERPGVLTAE